MKTLLGMGGSDDSFRALKDTLDRVEETGDELVVAVVENPEAENDAEEVAEHVRESIEEHEANVDVEVVMLEGHPGSALVEHAESGGYDEIVLGGGERSAMGKIQMGHIAEFVLLNSHVTVKLVR
jgi:nucleotide-binding universal stress UspA family protein